MQVKLLELLLTYSHHWSDGQGAERQRVVRGDESSGKIWAIQVSNLTERLLVSKTILLNTISFHSNGHHYNEDSILATPLMIEITFQREANNLLFLYTSPSSSMRNARVQKARSLIRRVENPPCPWIPPTDNLVEFPKGLASSRISAEEGEDTRTW